jgi:hypothetical protein
LLRDLALPDELVTAPVADLVWALRQRGENGRAREELDSAGVTTFPLPVLETATTSVTSSANTVANGTSITFTATVSPNGTPSTVVQNGTGSSSYWVPTGTVTFMDGSTALGSVTLNPLENGKYPSSYVQQVTFTTSSLALGTNAITAVYSGDQNFASGTSRVFDEIVAQSVASFVKTDTSTEGSWQGVYGSQGYNVIDNAVSYPSYAQVSTTRNSNYVWTTTSSDPRALQEVGNSNRIAAVWYSPTSFTVNLNLTDGQTHQLVLYLLVSPRIIAERTRPWSICWRG